MPDFSGVIDTIASLNDSVKESFEVLKEFLLNVELGVYSITFILLFISYLIVVFAILSSPAFFYSLYTKQIKALKDFAKGNKNPRDWIGKS